MIKVNNLTVGFEGKNVLENINFTVCDGDYLCVLGENGSGKTTLMRCLAGDIKYSGNISFGDIKRTEIGWLSQNVEIKNDFPTSVEEVVMSGFSAKTFFGILYNKNMKKAAAEKMKALEIYELKNSSFRELSGGQQQKTLLCRALCAANNVLLLDEPAASLDIASQNELYSHIRRLNNEGLTVIMVSHDIKRAVKEAKNILHISDKGYFFGSSEKYLESDEYRNGVGK